MIMRMMQSPSRYGSCIYVVKGFAFYGDCHLEMI